MDLGTIKLPPTEFAVPTGDSTIPYPEHRLEVHEAQAGGLNHIKTETWFVGESAYNDSSYGSKISGNNSDISNSKIRSLLREKGFDPKDYDFTNQRGFKEGSYVNEDGNISYRNQYLMMTVKKKDSFFGDPYGVQVIVSFEGIFDDYYKILAQNWTMMDLLKNLAKVSNRYMFVDTDNVIHLLPRGTDLNSNQDFYLGSAQYDKDDILKYEKKYENEDEYDMDVERLEYAPDNSINNYGIHLREGEYNGMRKFYSDYFSRDRIQYKITLTNNDYSILDNTNLLQKLFINDGVENKDYGYIIEIGRGMNENKIELITEDYDV